MKPLRAFGVARLQCTPDHRSFAIAAPNQASADCEPIALGRRRPLPIRATMPPFRAVAVYHSEGWTVHGSMITMYGKRAANARRVCGAEEGDA